MNHTKIVQADLDIPRRELCNGGLGIVVALLIFWQIFFAGSYWTSNPVVYIFVLCKGSTCIILFFNLFTIIGGA